MNLNIEVFCSFFRFFCINELLTSNRKISKTISERALKGPLSCIFIDLVPTYLREKKRLIKNR